MNQTLPGTPQPMPENFSDSSERSAADIQEQIAREAVTGAFGSTQTITAVPEVRQVAPEVVAGTTTLPHDQDMFRPIPSVKDTVHARLRLVNELPQSPESDTQALIAKAQGTSGSVNAKRHKFKMEELGYADAA